MIIFEIPVIFLKKEPLGPHIPGQHWCLYSKQRGVPPVGGTKDSNTPTARRGSADIKMPTCQSIKMSDAKVQNSKMSKSQSIIRRPSPSRRRVRVHGPSYRRSPALFAVKTPMLTRDVGGRARGVPGGPPGGYPGGGHLARGTTTWGTTTWSPSNTTLLCRNIRHWDRNSFAVVK